MAYTPTGIVSMCNVPFSTDRAHTRYFTTEQEQTTYFSSRVINTSLNYTFLRKDNIIRVPYNIEQIRNCNYVYYINQNFGNKIFYNFVTQVEYINENTTALHIQQDDFQTWMFNIRFLKSFVEREHTNDDTKYNTDNLIEEDISFSNYIFNEINDINLFEDVRIVVISTAALKSAGNGTYDVAHGMITYVNNIPVPYYFIVFQKDTTEATINGYKRFLGQMAAHGQIDSIVKVLLYPKSILDNNFTYVPSTEADYMGDVISTATFGKRYYTSPDPQNLNGYIPKNNKMFNYPFTYLEVCTKDMTQEYKYEYFSNGHPNFIYTETLSDSPKYILYPYNYSITYGEGILHKGNEEIFTGITGNIFCEMPYNKDSAAVEYALNRNYLNTNLSNARRDFKTHLATGIADVATTNMIGMPMAGAAFLTGGIGGAVTSIGSTAISSERAVTDTINTAVSDDNKRRLIEAKIKDTSNLPTTILGTCSDEITLLELNSLSFKFIQKTIPYSIAEKADNYLSVYGYKTNKFKIPNLTGRSRWNYVKTSGANIAPKTSGIIPPDTDIENIKNMFNNGITLWHDNNIMDYGDFTNEIV